MIILKVHTTGVNEDGIIHFHGLVSDHADGFGLSMPAPEWIALGKPIAVVFAISDKRLTIAREGEYREVS